MVRTYTVFSLIFLTAACASKKTLLQPEKNIEGASLLTQPACETESIGLSLNGCESDDK